MSSHGWPEIPPGRSQHRRRILVVAQAMELTTATRVSAGLLAIIVVAVRVRCAPLAASASGESCINFAVHAALAEVVLLGQSAGGREKLVQ